MGKFVQSQATDLEDLVTVPEKELWVAVLCRAVLDAVKGPPMKHRNQYTYDRDQARHFFMEGGPHFRHICEMAGRNPIYVQQKMRKVLLRKDGWNIDVPITSHYRQGPKRGRKRGKYKKKHLTGNSYYAAKRKKDPYYVKMGKLGGRPRMYNNV